MRRAPLRPLLFVLLGGLGSAAPVRAAPTETTQIRADVRALVAASEPEVVLRAVVCLRRHRQALGSVLAEMIRLRELDARAVVRLAPHVPDLGLDPPDTVALLEAIAVRREIPDLVVLAQLAHVQPVPSPVLSGLLTRVLDSDVGLTASPRPERPAQPGVEEQTSRHRIETQTRLLAALGSWHAQVPGIAQPLLTLALDPEGVAAVRLAAALVLARVALEEEQVAPLDRAFRKPGTILTRWVAATAIGDRRPEAAAARYATLREAFLAVPLRVSSPEHWPPPGPLDGLTPEDVMESLRIAGAELAPHLLTEIPSLAEEPVEEFAWLWGAASHMPLGPSVTPLQVLALLPPAAPEDPTPAQLDVERLLLRLLARMGSGAGDAVPVLRTRWQRWRLHPLGAGPCVRTEVALAAIRGAWREPLEVSAETLEGRGTQKAYAFLGAAQHVPALPIDEALVPSLVRGLSRGGEPQGEILAYLAGERRSIAPGALSALQVAVASYAVPPAGAEVRQRALRALLRLGGALPAGTCGAVR